MHFKSDNFNTFAIFFIILLFISGINDAQVRSRIMGVVKDVQTGEELIGANVIIKDTYLGAASDINGRFIIINVPVGTHTLQVSMIGYATQILPNVVVSADRVTNLTIELQPTVFEGQEVVVTAQKDELHKEVSNTQMVISSEQLKDASGVRQINAFLQKMPGISESNGFLTIRGGSSDQTGAMINGLSYNNAAVGNAETSIPMSAIDQVSLLSGGYNAEYGNFRSGLINITTKSGSKDRYHGTISVQRNHTHMKRFGDSFYDPYNAALKPYLDPNIAFIGPATVWANDPYAQTQYPQGATFSGWIDQAKTFNTGKSPENQASPMDLFLLAHWMHMAVPDYQALRNLPDELKQQIGYYEVPEIQKAAFESHRMVEENYDWNIDGGFGGPVPLIGKAIGDATFYISNNSSEQHYVMPFALKSQKTYTTLGTIRTTPWVGTSITYNGLWKRQIGLSPIRPAFGDAPNAANAGGFMPINNIRNMFRASESTGDGYYWYDPPFYPILEQTTLMNGININQILSDKTFLEFTVSYLNIKNNSPIGDNRDTTVLTQIGPFPLTEMPFGKLQFAPNNTVRGYRYPGYDAVPGIPRRFRSKEGDLYDRSQVSQFAVKLQIASQLDEHNYLKGGIEYNHIDINHKLWQKWNQSGPYNVYEFNYHRWPSQTGMFLQNQVTYNEIVANLGVRVDYYYGGGGKWPNDPFNTEMFLPQTVDTSLFTYLASGRSFIWDLWNQYDQQNPGFLQPIKNYLTVSPRIGVSFPVTINSKFYFNYGHFRSNPPYYTMYQFRYRYTKNGLYDMSNPNLEPPRTIQYELGLAYNFYENYILTISGYSKDVTGQAGTVRYNDASGSLDYNGRMNNQYEDIQGLEINITKNDMSWISGWINFEYMLKKTGYTGIRTIREISVDVEQDQYQGQESKTLPVPSVNANITFRVPESFGPQFMGINPLGGWAISVFARWNAGDYVSQDIWNPLGLNYIGELVRWPAYYMVDLKLTKTVKIAGLTTSFYLDVNNLFNIKVSQFHTDYPYREGLGGADFNSYLASLRLPIYNTSAYDLLRDQNPGLYIPGNDKIGDLRSEEKPYINDPNNSFWFFSNPRDIWFGMRVEF